MKNPNCKVVATATPEEIEAFRAWKKKDLAIDATAKSLIKAVMDSVNEEKHRLIGENQDLWKRIEKAHGIDGDAHHSIDFETGEITRHDHDGAAGVFVFGGGGEVDLSKLN